MTQKLLVNTVRREMLILLIQHIKEHGDHVIKNLFKSLTRTIFTDFKHDTWLKGNQMNFGTLSLIRITSIDKMSLIKLFKLLFRNQRIQMRFHVQSKHLWKLTCQINLLSFWKRSYSILQTS